MSFEKELQFLGLQENKFQDGSSYYKVSFFDPTGVGTVSVNVGGNNQYLIDGLLALKFGSLALCHFELVEREKLFKLALRAVGSLE